MPAEGESTADDPLTISVGSATTEEASASSSSRHPRKRASSAPKTLSPMRLSSASPRTKAGERRPSKTVAQCLQTTTKAKDREPRSPDQMKSRSSRSTSRKASAEEVPVSWAFGEGLGDFWRPPVPLARDQSTSHDNADAQLEREVQRQETIRQNLPVLNVFSQPRVLNNQLIDQLRNAEEKMQIFHLATRPIL